MTVPSRLKKSRDAWSGVLQIIEAKLVIAILSSPGVGGHHPIMSDSGEQIGQAVQTERGFELHLRTSQDPTHLIVIEAFKDADSDDLLLDIT